MSEPCRCHACTVAGVDRPSITIPAYRQIPARELHGVPLMEHYAAQDRLRATIDSVRKRSAEVREQESHGQQEGANAATDEPSETATTTGTAETSSQPSGGR